MTRYGQTVSIAATTAGVAGTIVVPKGARLRGINLSYLMVDDIVTKIAVTYPGAPTPLTFGVPTSAQTQTTQAAISTYPTPLIDLDLMIDAEKTITITVTSTGNITVRVGLMWDAA